jgi:hypothetical protein
MNIFLRQMLGLNTICKSRPYPFVAPLGKLLLLTALALLMMAPPFARADGIGYQNVVDLYADTNVVRAEHHHDWSEATRGARWKMISTTQNPFSSDNNYSYLRLIDKASGAELFRRPVPALSYIWISKDSRYVVGLSNIQLWNPYQLVVFSKSGERLLERAMTDVRWPGVTRSVTNWINWYREPSPRIGLVENGRLATLTVEDPLGVSRDFHFLASRPVEEPKL